MEHKGFAGGTGLPHRGTDGRRKMPRACAKIRASLIVMGCDGMSATAFSISAHEAGLILASTSPYRRELLARLRLPFACVAPAVDEARLPNEAPAAMAHRLALAKAQAVARLYPAAVVIGSDQVAELNGQPLGKPHTHDRARLQLQQQRGQTVLFHTAVAVVRHDAGFAASDVATIRTRFRSEQDGMSDAAIDAYLHAEQPYDCAGSIKSEGLGIALMASIDNDDPTALIGLPLMRTCTLLQAAGLCILPAAGAKGPAA